jgi:hypothetical protein
MTTSPWTRQQVMAAARRGSHKSAQDYVEFVCEEIWTVLPLEVAITIPHIRLSPLGVVPQRNRRPRLIVDYTYSGVNPDTCKMAPPEAMQFGKALQRILQTIVNADPRFGPVKLGKIDISDGFYRIGLQASDIPRLGVILPQTGIQSHVAFPLALPMGWVESPPYFTAATETACDLTNQTIAQDWGMPPPHRLEHLAHTPPDDAHSSPAAPGGPPIVPVGVANVGRTMQRRTPVIAADVYVDDFILMAQTRRHQQRLLRAALHSIDSVFSPRQPAHPSTRKEPISEKKLRQGDAHWSTRKTILGWDLDTAVGTLTLPPIVLHGCILCWTRTHARAAAPPPPNGTSSWASSARWPSLSPGLAACSRTSKRHCGHSITASASTVTSTTASRTFGPSRITWRHAPLASARSYPMLLSPSGRAMPANGAWAACGL